ncbi:hypothetical protein [Longispora albida]|uniref:hypothetical protein n=1 Tax=Longispora albida TaxID=203523 RepID=UPI00036E5789|nr:hypothetical protein [Longispora albida]
MTEALTAAAYVAATYRIALAETIRTVLDIGRCGPGDRVINYCSGDGEGNLAIAGRIGPGGVLYAVDSDAAALGGLAATAEGNGLTAVLRTVQHDPMTAADTVHVPTHITCLFGLHDLADPVVATERWALASSPATKMLTADWGAVWAPGANRPITTLPMVSPEWAMLTSATLEFQIPGQVPAARRALGSRTAPAMASVTIREWTRRSA